MKLFLKSNKNSIDLFCQKKKKLNRPIKIVIKKKLYKHYNQLYCLDQPNVVARFFIYVMFVSLFF